MIYQYGCEKCGAKFEVIKRVSEYKDPESCKCGYEATRVPFPTKIHLSGTAVQDKYFNHALGQVCTDTEAKQIAKDRGMIEVGNERIEKHVKPVEHSYDDVWKGA